MIRPARPLGPRTPRAPLTRLRRLALAATVLLVLASAPVLLGPQPASNAAIVPVTSVASARTTWSLLDPFSREVVRPGAVDVNPYQMAHVYELQRRLLRVGLFTAVPNGHYGPQTLAAVQAFQRRNGIVANGIVGAATWRALIQQSVRGRAAVPSGCRTAGWHACYDRSWHQVNLYHDGALYNSWLVRGGDYYRQTLTGTYRVYSRDIDHVSSLYGTAMPYAQFFHGGQALHGSPLMMDPYVGHSHGCVNFLIEDAHQLWDLAATRTLWVHVYGAWG